MSDPVFETRVFTASEFEERVIKDELLKTGGGRARGSPTLDHQRLSLTIRCDTCESSSDMYDADKTLVSYLRFNYGGVGSFAAMSHNKTLDALRLFDDGNGNYAWRVRSDWMWADEFIMTGVDRHALATGKLTMEAWRQEILDGVPRKRGKGTQPHGWNNAPCAVHERILSEYGAQGRNISRVIIATKATWDSPCSFWFFVNAPRLVRTYGLQALHFHAQGHVERG